MVTAAKAKTLSVGDTVFVKSDPAKNNGSEYVPGVVVDVSEGLVAVRAFDSGYSLLTHSEPDVDGATVFTALPSATE